MNNHLPPPVAPKPISVGDVVIDTPVVLAPMTGVTDLPFRKMVRRYGSGLNVTEMIASEAAIRETRQSVQKAQWDPIEEPVSMQLVGCDPTSMAEAAKLQEGNGAEIIDINFGCPVRKVVGQLAGSALMREVALATKLMEATVKAVNVPVTVKMRMGWDHLDLNAPELAHIAEDLGDTKRLDKPSDHRPRKKWPRSIVDEDVFRLRDSFQRIQHRFLAGCTADNQPDIQSIKGLHGGVFTMLGNCHDNWRCACI